LWHDTWAPSLAEKSSLRLSSCRKRFGGFLRTKQGRHSIEQSLSCHPGARLAKDQETRGHKCDFEKSRNKLLLRPIAFLSLRTTESEQSYEVSSRHWGPPKQEEVAPRPQSTWLVDCSTSSQLSKSTFLTHPRAQGNSSPADSVPAITFVQSKPGGVSVGVFHAVKYMTCMNSTC
jgi:hypothetical protein